MSRKIITCLHHNYMVGPPGSFFEFDARWFKPLGISAAVERLGYVVGSCGMASNHEIVRQRVWKRGLELKINEVQYDSGMTTASLVLMIHFRRSISLQKDRAMLWAIEGGTKRRIF